MSDHFNINFLPYIKILLKTNKVLFLSCSLSVIVILSGIFAETKIALLESGIEDSLKLNSWIVSHASALKTPPHETQKLKAENGKWILITIDQESRSRFWHPFTIQLQQTGDNQVRASFSKIDFDNLARGLEELSDKFHIQVKTINIERIGQTGYVKAEMLF